MLISDPPPAFMYISAHSSSIALQLRIPLQHTCNQIATQQKVQAQCVSGGIHCRGCVNLLKWESAGVLGQSRALWDPLSHVGQM